MERLSLAELFERQAVRHATDAAARCGDDEITFAELNRRANRVARCLLEKRLAPDGPIGICLHRSIDLLVALIGVVKAGRPYLPLDPAYPAERLAYMVADSDVRLILCTRRERAVCARLPVHAGTELVEVDSGGEGADAACDVNPGRLASASELAYVIYTSGSTGEPKGVLGTVEGMVNRLQWMWRRFPFRASEVGCVKTSLSFLDSFCEIFGPLLQGFPVVVMREEVVKDPAAFVGELERHGVTRLVVVPSLLRAMLATVPDIGERLRRLTLWVTSGEALRPELAERFCRTLPAARLLNLYGASEVSADCTWYDLADGPPDRVAIGRALPLHQVYLLDDGLAPVAAEAIGELYVSGVGLAWGYLGRPDLTAERFVPNARGAAGTRMYRTGDLARVRPDGALEFVGRADQQVKIRGFRVELGEIEAALRRYPQVGQAVVIASQDEGRTQLVGFVVPAPGAAVDLASLRLSLAQHLPSHMVPAFIVCLAELPLTPSGKLDRTALRAPKLAPALSPPFAREPSAPEAVLAALVADVLQLEHVPLGDSFFELGGDSITSMEFVSRARAAGFAISPGDLFRHQSVEALAALTASAPPL